MKTTTNNQAHSTAIILAVIVIMLGITCGVYMTRPLKKCSRSHVEVNNIPEHQTLKCTAYDWARPQVCATYEYVIVPAERREATVCDEYAKR